MSFISLPRRLGWPSIAAWVIGIIATAVSAWQIEQINRQRARDDFDHLAASAVAQIRSRIRLYEYGLRGARGAVHAVGPEGINGEIFHQYGLSRDVEREFPGARGFGFIRKVAPPEWQNFLKQARAERADFDVRLLGPEPKGDRFIIQYIEPRHRNQPAIGLDISSEPYRYRAAQEAMRTGEPTLTGPINLVQMGSSPHKAMLFLMPIYRNGMPTATPEQREAACYGWSYAPLALQEVSATFDDVDPELQITLSDITEAGTHIRLFTNMAANARPVLSTQTQLKIYGRVWSISASATPHFVAQREKLTPREVAWGGLLLSTLLAALVEVASIARQRRRTAAEMNARMAAIVTHSSDAIITIDLAGRVMHWNQAATRLFGWRPEEMLGQPLAQKFLPAEAHDEDDLLVARLQRGEIIAPYDSTRLTATGELVDVSVTACALRSAEDGRLVGVAKLLRDNSRPKAAERAMKATQRSLECEVQQRSGELALARKDLQTILDAMPSMIGYWDKHQCNRFANHAYLRWFGKEPSALLGLHIKEVLGRELYEQNRPHIEGALNGTPQTFERVIPRPDGKGLRASLTHYLPDIQHGEVEGFYVIAHDVSELVEGRRALDEERARLRNILESTYTGTWEWSLDGDRVKANARWYAIRGLAAEAHDLPGHDWLDSIHPDDRLAFEEQLQAHLRGDTNLFTCESRQRHEQGHWVWMRDSGRIMKRRADGTPLRLFGTTQDIHAARQAQQEREALSSLFAKVLESATEQSIIATNAAGIITVFNTGAERMLGFSAAEMIGKETPARFHLREEIRARAATLRQSTGKALTPLEAIVMESEQSPGSGREWTYVRKDGSQLQVLLNVTRQFDGEGQVIGYLGIAQDITNRVAQEQALKEAKQLAEAANQAKSIFLANMSHEIRTPLHAALGAIHLLDHTPLDEQQRHLLSQALMASRSLLGIVNDVLDLAKIEAGELDICLEEFDLGELLKEIDTLFSGSAAQKQLTFEVQGVPARHARLIGDPLRLRQVLSNLLSNAIKFTHQGSVSLKVESSTSMSSGNCMLKFEVHDSGIGIPPDQLDRIFQPFTQTDGSATRQFGGTGLGLSIVRELVRLMNGQVGVRSEPGEGSTFWFSLALDLAAAVPRPAGQQLLHVVMLDDDADRLLPLSRLCSALGWRNTPCTDLMQAITLCANLMATGNPLPDVMLVHDSISLDDLSTSIQELCRDVPLSQRPVMIPMSSNALPTVLSLDGTRPLPSPCDPSLLFDGVNAAVAHHTGSPHHVTRHSDLKGVPGTRLAGLHILLVDDSEINLDIGRRLLELEGAHVSTATQGQEALTSLQDRGDIDAVLMDLQMPVMDGFQATQLIRQQSAWSHVPVLALTAGALPSERNKASAAGADTCLSKPLHPDLLVREIRACIEGRRGGPLPLSAPASVTATPH